ncbi:NAD-dependent epimerase/dehydratase family protein [Microbacterium sp. SY138]|uniref:NAD-dependent epimerase/dehydratase family protein n=1 Tax=unclassified Microbacterium TaxID=2609290 RepID=UPI00321A55BD
MKVLLTGSTGYIGSAILTSLTSAGHEVTALVRTEDAATAAGRAGVAPAVGDMRDAGLVTELANTVNAVIHAATPGDETSSDADNEFADAVLAGLGDRGAAFIRTGGIWIHGSGSDLTEETPHDPPALVAWRSEIDRRILTASGIRAVLVEPAIVYGHGGGIPNIVTRADAIGSPPGLQLLGDGTQHWGTVHVDDLADLYVLALEKAPHGAVYLGASGHNPTVLQIGEAASRVRGFNGKVTPESTARTVERLGAFGEALLLDQQASGRHARESLGWAPKHPTLITEINEGHYTD